MPKYLYQGSYTLEGVKGLLNEGGSKRRDAARQAVESVGGRLESFHFAFGQDDAVLVIDAPDNVSVAAVSMAVAAAGGFRGRVTTLLTPEEADEAVKKAVKYRPPGQ
jgi:uncharacterized protein with GYD domain